MLPEYDVIVVGAGHAGCEAAHAAAKIGASTLLITMDMNKMAQMSCNPAVGGIAKGQIVKEIDALGGLMGIVTDRSSIQFRLLNKSKGPAMWSPRSQCDRMRFSEEWRNLLENTDNLDFWQDMVDSLVFENNTIRGVITRYGTIFKAKSVILTNGTFLNGLMHVGRKKQEGGRSGEASSKGLSEQLLDYGFEVGRMKTGTPARLDGRTINFEEMIEQGGDNDWHKFSFNENEKSQLKQRSCYITHTNEKVHDVLKSGFNDSPLFNGTIKSIGPRYCPSIEDKVVTFSDKNQHQLFIEPEGENTVEYYINGFSSSLPLDIQYEALKKVKGLEKVKIFRPGYAIEYDFFLPTQLKHTLETKYIDNLFFAGQINGTTGYEEAAAQGMMAGINAANKAGNKKEFVLKRDQAYIGVLIDDLVTKGVDEPYRMFTSRAEYRILLRQDNVDERLTEIGYKLGLVNKHQYEIFINKLNQINKLENFIATTSVKPNEVNDTLKKLGTQPLRQGVKFKDIISRPQVSINNFINQFQYIRSEFTDEIIERTEIKIKYSGYINREENTAKKINRLENIYLNENFDYYKLKSLSTEARQKLTKIKPKTIGQASRISGVNPSDINVLLIYFGR